MWPPPPRTLHATATTTTAMRLPRRVRVLVFLALALALAISCPWASLIARLRHAPPYKPLVMDVPVNVNWLCAALSLVSLVSQFNRSLVPRVHGLGYLALYLACVIHTTTLRAFFVLVLGQMAHANVDKKASMNVRRVYQLPAIASLTCTIWGIATAPGIGARACLSAIPALLLAAHLVTVALWQRRLEWTHLGSLPLMASLSSIVCLLSLPWISERLI